MERAYRFWLGVDWGSQTHQICLVDADGCKVQERSVEHSGRAIRDFLERLSGWGGGDRGAVAVAIEVPRGPWVEALLERGFAVYAINPKQLDRFRDRYTVAGAKDDRRDAFVLADSLRTDPGRYHRLRPEDPWTVRLRELTRVDAEARKGLQREANRLRDLLGRYYPSLLRLSPGADEPWLWALLKAAPTPQRGARLGGKRIESILRRHRIRRWPAAQVQEQLRAPALELIPGTVEALSEHALELLPLLRIHKEQRETCEKKIAAVLESLGAEEGSEEQKTKHRDVLILQSCDGVGLRVTATMLVEAGEPLERREYQKLRLLSGVGPVTKRSGKRWSVSRRYACNKRLADAVLQMARVNIQSDPRNRSYYEELRGRGHAYNRALRAVADRLLRVICHLLEEGELYQRGYQDQPEIEEVA